MERPDNETIAQFERTTIGGRRLQYTLKVIQEPQKARACGAGPRSSADRRPVDPPPVVQLDIVDINKHEDITMSYDSGFMLYASLEVARPIAQGRMVNGPTGLPVLTGVCVASTAYLERPEKAGYFIFPDLSVRHEGWYRLKFSLFEAVKHAADADTERPFVPPESDNKSIVNHESMANRMEVQSKPFQVFSAKKFPGLSQSTEISKLVADQGCRVRIRREIRQRKRTSDDKPGPDNDMRSSRQTPEAYHAAHSRTASRNSLEGHYAAIDPMRRTSMESLYQRPAPSRAQSIASVTHPSPTTPTASQMPAMPPPITNRPWDMTPTAYSPALQQSSRFGMSHGHFAAPPSPARPEPSMTLPPINTAHSSGGPPSGHNPSPRFYSLPEPASTKRGLNPRTYHDEYSMKAGARPDTVRPDNARLPDPVAAYGHIEVESGPEDGDDDKGDYFYSRANGSRGLKVAQLLS